MIRNDYDAIVIGGGASGGIAACVLAEAGQRVLLLERGRALKYKDVPRDHLRNHRQMVYGDNTPPHRPEPRVFVDSRGIEHVLPEPHMGGWNSTPMTLGGGTRVYGAQAWRFHPLDFRMATTYGVPKGSSLADWPISYDELAPYYQQAEWELGVCGDDTNLKLWHREKPFPLPPFPLNPSGMSLKKAADALGWDTLPVPLLINSQAYNGRPACIRCGNCVGQACPSDSKTGSHNTTVPRAVATGNCDLVTSAQAERIDTDASGKVIGVTFIEVESESLQRHSVRAKRVIVACSAIESSRVLLMSSSKHHPNGLGNHSDHVGRHLQGHLYVGAYGISKDVLYDGEGPGPTISTLKFNHGNPGIIGGGLLANEFLKTPYKFWSDMPATLRPWGVKGKQFMRHAFTRAEHVQGPVQDIPTADSRVTLDPKVRDRFGLPAVRLSGTVHPTTIDAAKFLEGKARQWIAETKPDHLWSWCPQSPGLSAGQHQAGTARMGNDPKESVTDKWGRVHGHENLFVADGSTHVTNGGFNPVLTIIALAYRVSDGILKSS